MGITKETRLRVEACAWIIADEKAAKVAEIASAKGVTTIDAATMYVWGIIKADIRRGVYSKYDDALTALEYRQSGDTGNRLSVQSPISREVARINAINNKGTAKKPSHASKGVRMAKVIGELYVQWAEQEEMTAPDYIMHHNDYMAILGSGEEQYSKAIRAYMDEYYTRLSVTARGAARLVAASGIPVADAMRAKEGKGLSIRNKIKYLYRGFPARDVMTAREFGELLVKYAA